MKYFIIFKKMEYELDFVKIFIPKLTYLHNNIIENFIKNKYYYLKQNNIMLSRRDFRSGYPDFNINIYYIFNDDIKNLEELKIRNHWHTIGKTENRISNIKDFFKKYNNFDNKLFYMTNKKLIEDYYKENYTSFFDIKRNKLNQELINMKMYDFLVKNKINFIKSIYDFFITNIDINIEIIGLFNKDLFKNHISKRNMSDNEIKDIIYFYYEENEKEERETIFNEEEFYKKYNTFDLEIFRKFNKKFEKVDKIICISEYHYQYKKNKMIGNLGDFLDKNKDFDLDKFKENMLNKKISIIDNLVEYNENEDYRKELEIVYNTEKNIISEEKYIIDKDFDWLFYLDIYPDLGQNGIFTEEQAYQHWLRFGKEEGRKCCMDMIIKCNNNYQVKKEIYISEYQNNKFWAHLHCHNIDKFNQIYGSIIENLIEKFSVIVTYIEGIKIPNYNFKVIKVKNFDFSLSENIIKKKIYDNLIISNGENIILLTKNIVFDNNIFNLFFEFKKIDIEILSPLVLFENKLVYYGGVINKDFEYYINNKIIDITKYFNKSLFYTKKTDIFFEDIYITKLYNFLEIFKSKNYLDFKKYLIYVTPFIKVNMIKEKTKFDFVSNKLDYGKINLELYNFNSKYYLKDINLLRKTKNILIIEHSIITPDKDCGSKYIYNFIKTLLKLKYNIYYFQCNFNNNPVAQEYILDLQSKGIYVSLENNNWNYNKIEFLLEDNFNLFDYIFVSRYDKMNKYYDCIRKYNPSAKLCYQTHDLNFLRCERENDTLNLNNTNLELDKKNELNLIRNSDISIVVSKYEYDLLTTKYNIGKNKLFNYPIFFESTKREINYNPYSNNIIFIGSIHKPNLDSIKYFLENYFKDIIENIPNIVLNIVGSCCDEIKKYENIYKNNLKLHYYISDEKLEDLFLITKLSIIPLLYGSGIKGKVLDSFNYAVPVITSTIGAEGIICSNYDNIIILDYDDNYIEKFVNFYKDIELLIKISKKSKEIFEDNYSNINSISYCRELFKQIDNTTQFKSHKTKRICIIFQLYDNIIFKEIYSYFNNLCTEYNYNMLVINNNRRINITSGNDNITIIEGDNTNHEMSAYHKAINYLLEKDLYKKYTNFILCNDTMNIRNPITFFNKINYNKFRNIIDSNYVCGIIDSFNKEYYLDDFKFTYWIRSNLIIFPNNLFLNIKNINIYTKSNIYDGNKLKIKVEDALMFKIKEWLSNKYYKNVDKKAKTSRIFNEYKLTHNLLKNYNKEIVNLYDI